MHRHRAGWIEVMPKYRATLQVSGITGESPRAVRSALDEQLRTSGFENCHVVRVDLDAPPPTARSAARGIDDGDSTWQQRGHAGGLLLVAAAAWAIWFFWWMLSGPGE